MMQHMEHTVVAAYEDRRSGRVLAYTAYRYRAGHREPLVGARRTVDTAKVLATLAAHGVDSAVAQSLITTAQENAR